MSEIFLIMAYREDKDLEFLQHCSNEDLQILADVITKDKNGELRFTENLSLKDNYKKYYPHNLKAMWQDIAEELQLFGGNTLANIFRGGEGVLYKEILMDVAKKLKVNFNKNNDTELIENYVIQKITEKGMEKMSLEELKVFAKEMDIPFDPTIGSKQALEKIIFISIKNSGFQAYKISVIIANTIAKQIIGKGLTFAGNRAVTGGLSRLVGISLGPIGWALSAIWTLTEIASPAYRVTMRVIPIIIFMRKNRQYL